jgi:L-fuconolactonase
VALVVDAHHHFWDPARATYPWMTDALASIRRRFGPEDLRPLLAANGVDRTVLVQTLSSLGETREFLATAAANEFIAGVVGWVDLTEPDLAEQLTALRAGPGGAKLVGIRHQVHDEADPEWLGGPDVRRGIAAVGKAGLAYDILVRTRELPSALALVRDFPSMRFVIDHIAKPPIASGAIDEWAARLRPLAECPNVFCKLSGMVTEAAWKQWRAEDFRCYLDIVLEAFGMDRVMIGSDWPVCTLSGEYAAVMGIVTEYAEQFSAEGRDAILGGNCARSYGISGLPA